MEIRVSSKSSGGFIKGVYGGGRVWGRGGGSRAGGSGVGDGRVSAAALSLAPPLCSRWDSAGFVCLEYRPLLLSALLGQPLILDSQAICLRDAGQNPGHSSGTILGLLSDLSGKRGFLLPALLAIRK